MIQRFALAIIATTMFVCSASAQDLEYKLSEGDQFNFELTQKMKMKMSGEGVPGGESEMNQIVDMVWNVKSVDEKKQAKVEQTVDRMRMKMTGPVTFEYDSKSEKKAEGVIASMVTPTFEALVGAKYMVVLAKNGEVVDVEFPQDVVDKLAKSPAGAMMGDLASKEGLEKMSQQGSLVFPEGKLEVGKEWTNKISMKNPGLGVEQTVTSTYKYLGTKEVDGKKLEAFDLDVNLTFGEPKEGTPGPKAKITEQDSVGIIYFDREHGILYSSNLTTKMTMAIEVGPRKLESKLEQTVNVKVRPVTEQ